MKFLVIVMLCLSLSACISRLSRPQIMGVVVNAEGQPLTGVQVGETITDSTGYFSLKERRYYAFLLKEILYMEAPPLYISEAVTLKGYQQCQIHSFDSRGGGSGKGATWSVGQVVIYPVLAENEVKSPQDCELKTL